MKYHYKTMKYWNKWTSPSTLTTSTRTSTENHSSPKQVIIRLTIKCRGKNLQDCLFPCKNQNFRSWWPHRTEQCERGLILFQLQIRKWKPQTGIQSPSELNYILTSRTIPLHQRVQSVSLRWYEQWQFLNSMVLLFCAQYQERCYNKIEHP